jgi:tetratricopeptide (TPR) repeat protein
MNRSHMPTGQSRIVKAAVFVEIVISGSLLFAIFDCRAAPPQTPTSAEVESRPEQVLAPAFYDPKYSNRLEIVVVPVEGESPSAKALAGFQLYLNELAPPGAQWRVTIGTTVGRVDWNNAQPSGVGPLLDTVFKAAAPGLMPQVVIVYPPPRSPIARGRLGEGAIWLFGSTDPPRIVYGFFVYSDVVTSEARLLVSADDVEQSTLVHEFGHLLGLVTNLKHADSRSPSHCLDKRCVMAHVDLAFEMRNALALMGLQAIPRHYCAQCMHDVQIGQQSVSELRHRDPAALDNVEAVRTAKILRDLAESEYRLGRTDIAIKALQAARKVDPSSAAVQATLTDYLVASGKTQDRGQGRGAGLVPTDRISAMKTGQELCNLGRYSAAVELLEPWSRGWSDAHSMMRFGRIWTRALIGARRSMDAATFWSDLAQNATLTPSEQHSARFESGRALRRAHQYVAAAEVFEPDLQYSGLKRASAAIQLARIDIARGDVVSRGRHLLVAIQELEPMGRVDPPSGFQGVQALALLSLACALDGRTDQALTTLGRLEAALQATPQSAITWRVMTFSALHDNQHAMEALHRISVTEFDQFDPCLEEDLEGLRAAKPKDAAFLRCHVAGTEPDTKRVAPTRTAVESGR